MDPQTRLERQDARVWAIEQLIRYEGMLDPRMYECADYATSAGSVQDVKDLYTLWVEWKRNNPSNNPQINRLQRDVMSHRFTTTLEEDDYGDLILTIPYEICEELGWNVDTELQFELGDDGNSIVLKKAID